ncbi:hypothetical protein ACHHYP_03397 [Achlya hypogyna]|uniref:tRNA-intron lyase n=1 Tax=Achlya hypogyna TaxID=1202772 RepID=A0A1V9ZRA9_ACHHY|nr:hypothetical protein ACHHYP_03397 [Achlya hypogyna]
MAEALVARYHAGAGAVSVPVDAAHETWLVSERYGFLDGDTRWLSLEEGVYLATSGRLVFESMMSTTAYELFHRSDPDFAVRYALYHHYRSAGWIVQSGLAYGTLYALYRESPDVVHSEYLVYLDPANKPMSWNSMQVLTRLSEDVKKTILLCQLHDTTTAPTKSTTITSLHGSFGLTEVMFRYWPAIAAPDNASSAYAMRPATMIPKRKRR